MTAQMDKMDNIEYCYVEKQLNLMPYLYVY